jgi:hypothetical protein
LKSDFVASCSNFVARIIPPLGDVPRVVRADRGTENVNVYAIQRFLREDSEDSFAGEKSFIFGTSTSNQKIEPCGLSCEKVIATGGWSFSEI